MSEVQKLIAKKRDGKAGASRQAEQVPAVLYGHGIENVSVAVDAKKFGQVWHRAGNTSLVELDVDGKEHNVLIREVQLHPVHDHVMHVDFYQVRMDKVVRAQVPLVLTGEAGAVRDLGGVLVRSMDTVEVEALPKDLPHDIKVDISVIDDFEKVIHVSDLPLPEGVTALAEPNEVITLVQAPRTEEELEELSEEVTEDIEGVEGVAEETEEGEEGAEEGEGEVAGDEAGGEKPDEKPDEKTEEKKE